jgi:hypothetical protein
VTARLEPALNVLGHRLLPLGHAAMLGRGRQTAPEVGVNV